MDTRRIRAAIAEGTRAWTEEEPDRIRERDAALVDLRRLARDARACIDRRVWEAAADHIDEMAAICRDWGDSGDLPEAAQACRRRENLMAE